MNNLLKLTFAVCLSGALSGCVIVAGEHGWNDNNNWESQQEENRELISQLTLQSQRSDVIKKLGNPNFSDAFMKQDDEYRILYYRTQHRKSDGETTKDETTPLIFKNDKLIGWGEEILASVR